MNKLVGVAVYSTCASLCISSLFIIHIVTPSSCALRSFYSFIFIPSLPHPLFVFGGGQQGGRTRCYILMRGRCWAWGAEGPAASH